MKFRTVIPIPNYPFKISHDHSVLLMGSCFSDHIGNFFSRSGFNTCSNPFGTLFNPLSIAQDIELLMNPEQFDDTWCDFFNNQWISYAHYTKFSHADKTLFEQRIAQQLQDGTMALQRADYLFLTFGTAFAYRLKERNLVVANCHKIPAAKFQKFRLSVDDIVRQYRKLTDRIFQFNPKVKIIFTISPVRHLSDGFHENTLSKSVLHLAVEQLVDNQSIFYFPAYEIVNDDLRDYRFYDADLSHPGKNAIEYVEEIVSQAFFTESTLELCRQYVKAYKAVNHRIINDK